MIRLPALTADQPSWQLPLSGPGAVSLLEGLLNGDVNQAAGQFTKLLADEATLLLWSVCRSPLWQTRPPGGLEDVASWLAGHGLHVLRWDESGSPSVHACSPIQLEQWAALAGQSAEVSRLAAELVEPREVPSALLLGLLHNAEMWLAACGPKPEAANLKLETARLPGWLTEWLRGCDSRTLRDSITTAVSRAIALRRQAEGGERRAEPVGEEDAKAAGEGTVYRVRQRWLASRAELGGLVPPMIQKLARLRGLEERFAETLEKEKLEALKAFAYGASHEINNPLANISTRAQTLLRDEKDSERVS